jgi:hypothetical protein
MSAKRQFDPQAFLAIVGTGKEILKYRKGRGGRPEVALFVFEICLSPQRGIFVQKRPELTHSCRVSRGLLQLDPLSRWIGCWPPRSLHTARPKCRTVIVMGALLIRHSNTNQQLRTLGVQIRIALKIELPRRLRRRN